ncbi:MAG: metalloprotease TldD [Bryobacterales bacterium]|nr:metalloprotease TldD [Bryobacterales bacterium]
MTGIRHFEPLGVTPALIHHALNEALARGGGHCDLYFEHKLTSYIGAEDGQVRRAFTQTDLGLGIRVVDGDATGYSFTEDLAIRPVRETARTAAAIAASSPRPAPATFRALPTPRYYGARTPWEDVETGRKIAIAAAIQDRVQSLDTRLVMCSVQFNDEVRHILIVRSDGVIASDTQPLTSAYVRLVAERNGKREEGFYGLSGRYGIEYYTPEILDHLAREAVARTLRNFDAAKAPAGRMDVVLAPGTSGILLHEAIGHGLEADFNRNRVSVFTGRIGQRVAPSFVSIIDDGTNPDQHGSIHIDDEGNPSRRTVLVENGILTSYMHDELTARHYGVEPTGNGRRDSFRSYPIPRMRNTYMLPGPHTPEEIIGSVRHGIYAEEFTNGEVLIGAGDFSFNMKLGYLIENGKLTRPLKDVNIIGNGPEALRSIRMAGNDLRMSRAASCCSKEGQAVPVQMGLPTVRIEGLTAGGSAHD